MTLFHYIDRAGTLGKLERTPQGGYRVPATVARTGVMLYSADGLRRQGMNVPESCGEWVRVYTPPAALQAAADTLRDAPVTNEHPPQFVTPKNFRKFSAGSVSGSTVEFDGQYLKAMLVIQDADLLADIELGKRREVSLGYLAHTRFESGTTSEGEPYDAVRDQLEYNHAAVVSQGRAGAQVCLALDSEEIPGEMEPTVLKIVVDGKEYEGEAAQAVVDGLRAKVESKDAKIAELEKQVADSAAQLAEATSEEAFQARLKQHQDAAEASRVRAEKVSKVKAAYPKMVLDGKSDEVIDALFDTLDDAGLRQLEGKVPAAAPVVKVADSAAKPRPNPRAAMLAANREYPRTGENGGER